MEQNPKKQKSVQIPEEVFWDCFRVCCNVLNDDLRAYLTENDLEIVERLEKALEAKLDKMLLHEIYSKSKDSTLTDAEREQARQDYLNRKGIHENFRW